MDRQQRNNRARMLLETIALEPENIQDKVIRIKSKDYKSLYSGFGHGALVGKFEELVPLTTMAAVSLLGKGIYHLFDTFPNWDHGRRFISPLCLTIGCDPSGRRFFEGTRGTCVLGDLEGTNY